MIIQFNCLLGILMQLSLPAHSFFLRMYQIFDMATFKVVLLSMTVTIKIVSAPYYCLSGGDYHLLPRHPPGSA